MTPIDLIAKSISLIYYENKDDDLRENNSNDLIRTAIDMLFTGPGKKTLDLSNDNITSNLLKFIINIMSDHSIIYDRSALLQSIKSICHDNEDVYDTIEVGICDDKDLSTIRKIITHNKRMIENFYRERSIAKLFNKASYDISNNRGGIKDINNYTANIILELEGLNLKRNSRDEALIREFRSGDATSIDNTFANIDNMLDDSCVYQTGWKDINEMLSGGFRPGEATFINALQNSYKSGFTTSLFAQLAINNTPKLTNPSKKPLIKYISLEDTIEDRIMFLIQYLKYDEDRIELTKDDIKNMSTEEKKSYVMSRLESTGFHIHMKHVDPTKWSYRNIISEVNKEIANGYEVKICITDYLAKLPTTGCINTGGIGTDFTDMVKRLKNFFMSKGILWISPHQLSSADVGALLRNGIEPQNLVKMLPGKNYTAISKQLAQETDLELFVHPAAVKDDTYLTVQLGRRRLPLIVPNSKKFVMYKFPKTSPVPSDIRGERLGMRKIPISHSDNSNDFSF